MLKHILICSTVILCMAASCKKSEHESNRSRRDMLIGRWQWVEHGPDSVNLNRLDTIETSPFAITAYVYGDSSKGLRITEYTSGSTTYIDTVNFTWLLSQDEKTIISSYQSAINTFVDSIYMLTNSTLILRDDNKAKGGVYNYWKVMQKQ